MDDQDVRLAIVKVVVPQATRVGLSGDGVIDTCRTLENYVLGSKTGEKQPDSPSKRGPGRPPKNRG